jgi:hypothetical protein
LPNSAGTALLGSLHAGRQASEHDEGTSLRMPIERMVHFVVPQRIDRTQEANIRRARSFAAADDTQVRIWQDPIDPSGFELSHYWPSANSGAQLADLIRLEVVYRFGGMYLDSDVFQLRSFLPIMEELSFAVASEDGHFLTNAVFGASAGHQHLGAMIDELLRKEPDWTAPPNVTTGPAMWRESLRTCQGLVPLPRQCFYPYNWNRAAIPPPAGAFAEHQWAGSWLPGRLSSWRHLPGRIRDSARHRLGVVSSRHQRRRSAASHSHKFSEEANSAIRLQPTLLGYRRPPLSAASDEVDHARSMRQRVAMVEIVEQHIRGGDYVLIYASSTPLLLGDALRLVGDFGRVILISPTAEVRAWCLELAQMNGWQDRLCVGATESDLQAEYRSVLALSPPISAMVVSGLGANRQFTPLMRNSKLLATSQLLVLDCLPSEQTRFKEEAAGFLGSSLGSGSRVKLRNAYHDATTSLWSVLTGDGA